MIDKAIYYDNLSQSTGTRVVYLRSTDVEQRNYRRLLWSVPDEWLYLLSQNNSIVVRDISSGKGKIEHIFIPILTDVLNALYAGLSPQHNNLKDHYVSAWQMLAEDNQLMTKFKFWKGRISCPVSIGATTIHITKERNPLTLQRTQSNG